MEGVDGVALDAFDLSYPAQSVQAAQQAGACSPHPASRTRVCQCWRESSLQQRHALQCSSLHV